MKKPDPKNYFDGEPCRHCGGTQYYIRGQQHCVVCSRRRTAERKQQPRTLTLKKINAVDIDTRERCAAELEQRRHKPNPDARPAAENSAALKVLRANLRRCREPELRARLQAAIAAVEAIYRPRPERHAPCAAPDPVQRPARRGSAPLRKSTRTMVPADVLDIG